MSRMRRRFSALEWGMAAGMALFVFLPNLKAQGRETAKSHERAVVMVDPSIDDTGPFCYLAKPTSQIAVPGVTKGTQFTFDGALNNGAAELCFFYGNPLKPLMQRQKVLLDGWIPVYGCDWHDADIAYHLDVFGSLIDDGSTTNVLNFVQVRIRNEGSAPAQARLVVAIRYSGFDHRFTFHRYIPFSPDWTYQMKDGAVIRDGMLIYTFPSGAKEQAVEGVDYTKPFAGRTYDISARAECCLARYDPQLAPGEEKTLEFKMPAAPVRLTNTTFIDAIRKADPEAYRTRWIQYWRDTLASGTQISIPEKKVMDAWRANLVHCMEAIWSTKDGQWVQGVNKFQYNWFWIRDGAFILRSYELLGHNDLAAKLLPYFLRWQQPDGNFVSQKGELDGFGQALFALGQHYLFTGDRNFAARIFPRVPKAIAWLRQARAKDKYHLMPPTTVMDNEYISGRYTGHNFWALLGVRQALILARATGHEADAASFREEYTDFRRAFMLRLEAVCGKDGYIPPGLDVKGGQDWGNLLGVYPTEVLDRFDPRVTTTIRKMHQEKYVEGIMTYKGRLHLYLTTSVTETHVARGEQEQALQDLYHILLHTDSTNAGFEWTAVPWGDRDVDGNFPPHGWYAARLNALLRNMLVAERGGNGGVNGRELDFFSVVSPAWAVPGKEVSIRNALTELGPVSAALRFRDGGADFTLDAQYRRKPIRVILHIPYFEHLDGFTTDAQESRLTADGIELSPDVTKVSLTWSRKYNPPLSFQTTVEAYKKEYRFRYDAYRLAGNEPLPVEAPPMLTAAERKLDFGATEQPQDKGIAVGKPVTSNGPPEAGHGPQLVVDGNAKDENKSSWWAGPPTPRWVQIDLEKPVLINRIRVFPYWDYTRFYRYTVEISLDAKKWTVVGDRSRNTKPATPLGDLIQFQPIKARYVRVTMLYNSANTSVHLVEVRVFAAKDKGKKSGP